MPTRVLAPTGIFTSMVSANDSNAKAEQAVSHLTVLLMGHNVVASVQVMAVFVYKEHATLKSAMEKVSFLMKDTADAEMAKNIVCLFSLKMDPLTIGAVTTITVIVVMPLPMGNVDSALVTTILVPSTTVLLTNPSMHGVCMDAGSIQI